MDIKITVSITPNLKRLLSQPKVEMTRAIRSGMTNLVSEIEARAVKEAPVRTGNLVDSISSNVSMDGTKGQVNVGAEYGLFVHRGTGLFGPFKQLIRPTTKKALFWPGAAHPVKSVKGMKPNPFFTRAIKKIKPQEVFEKGMMGYLKF